MADLDFEALAQPALRGLKAYDPGLDIVALRARWPAGRLVELGSNENSHGPGPAARAAVLEELGREDEAAQWQRRAEVAAKAEETEQAWMEASEELEAADA